MGLICVKNGSISQKAKIWKILLHHNGIDEKNLMHNLKKIYLMMSDRLHDAVNDFSHPRSEDLSKVNQKSVQHREFKTIILGNRSVKTELYSKIMGANRKVWIPYLFGNAAIFCQDKNFQKLEASSKKINLALDPKKSLSWIKPPFQSIEWKMKNGNIKVFSIVVIPLSVFTRHFDENSAVRTNGLLFQTNRYKSTSFGIRGMTTFIKDFIVRANLVCILKSLLYEQIEALQR